MFKHQNVTPDAGAVSPHRTRVTFLVRCRQVVDAAGEQLVLVGDHPALGSWEPARGVPMTRQERSSTPEPVSTSAIGQQAHATLSSSQQSSRAASWSCEVVLDNGSQLNYKYCIVARDPDSGVIDQSHEPRFESFEGNRRLKVMGIAMRVDDHNFGERYDATDESRIRVDYGRVFGGFEAPRQLEVPSLEGGSVGDQLPYSGASSLLGTLPPLTNPPTLIIVIYRLPVIAKRSERGWSFSWDDDALYLTSLGLRRGLDGKIRILWVGVLNCDDEVPIHEQSHVSNTLYQRFGCIPVFLPTETRMKFYQGFCKGVLWPLFHMITEIMDEEKMETKKFDRSLWHVYCTVNRKFADTVVAVYHEHDLIWIHDYHLMVLPSQLRRKLSGAKIGFFLHTPWPSSEIYRMLPVRDELLRGLLSSSLIGFHLFDYARHFLSACVRLLNLEHESSRGALAVEYSGRHVMIRVSHIGVDPDRFRERLDHPNVRQAAETLAGDIHDRIVLCGIDDLDIVKGIALKLQAFETLLQTYPGYHRRLVLMQAAIPKAARVKPYVRDEIRSLVERINGRYGSAEYRPVVYIERDITFDERVAMYSLADAIFLTPIRDGLNLVPYEYVVSASKSKGQLILSEFTGCSRALSGAVRINPWNREEVAAAIDSVLQNNDEVKQRKHAADYSYVCEHTTATWAYSFLSDLERASEPVRRLTRLGLGYGVGARLVEFEGFQHVSPETLSKAMRESSHRLILLDYDGTLTRADQRHARMAHAWAKPSETVMQYLEAIADNPQNFVVIMSGRTKEVLEQAFKDLDKVGLAAEHGFYYRWNGSCPWQESKPNADLSWIEVAHEIMLSYMERTDGSYIERKTAGLVWHYKDADPEFGSWQASEMHDHLESVLSSLGVQVISGNRWVQVRLRDVNKGIMVETILRHYTHPTDEDHATNEGSAMTATTSTTTPGGATAAATAAGQEPGQLPDFVLCCGDDRTDEDMFTRIDRAYERCPPAVRSRVFTCVIGVKPSNAHFYIRDYEEMMEILAALATASMAVRPPRSATLEDFRLSMAAGSPLRSDLRTSLDNDRIAHSLDTSDDANTTGAGLQRRWGPGRLGA
jgi:trehalose 6-phosphate synthase/phosphatase